MAHIEQRKLSDGTTAYRVIWTDPSGRRRRKQFSKATGPRPASAAKDFKIRIEHELRRGTYVDPRSGDMTVREYVTDTRPNLVHLRGTTQRRIDTNLATHLLPLIGDMKIGAIRRREIQEMVNALTVKTARGTNPPRPLAPATVRGIYQLAAGIFRSAVLDGIITTSPCVRVTLPARPDSEIIIPTTEQVAVIAERMPPRYRALILLAAGSGLRSAELRGLDTSRLRVLERTVKVDRQLSDPRPGDSEARFGPPKTDAAYRTVPLASSYAQVVAEHLSEFGVGELDLVFPSVTGRALRRQVLGESLRPILTELGFPPRSGMHLFRHYYVSGLIAAGVDLQMVMRLVGHESPNETIGTYGHLWPGHEERTREAAEAAFPAPETGRRGAARGAQGAHRGSARTAAVTNMTSRTSVGKRRTLG